MKKIIIIVMGISLLILAGCSKKEVPEPLTEEPVAIEEGTGEISETPTKSFEECMLAGFPVMESYPRQCNDGITTYTEIITTSSATGVIDTGTTSLPDQSLVQTGSTGSNINAIGEYIEKLRDKKTQETNAASPTPAPKTVEPPQPPVQPATQTSAQQPAPTAETTSDPITDKDIENLEKIINEIAK